MISSKKYVDETLKKYQIQAKPSLGQNFLVEEKIVDTMIHQLNLNSQSIVLEIGPGLGALTEKLVALAKHVYAIEIDNRMCTILKETLGQHTNLTIIHHDFLKFDFTTWLKNIDTSHLSIVSNLPYYVTSAILNKLIFNAIPFSSLMVMMQKEVGKKLMNPQLKEKSPLHVILDYQYNLSIVEYVSKNAYLPRPNIDSIVLKITPKTPKIKVHNEMFFYQLIKHLFQERRKTLVNNLQAYFPTKEETILFLNQRNITCEKRVEQLTLDEIIEICNHLC